MTVPVSSCRRTRHGSHAASSSCASVSCKPHWTVRTTRVSQVSKSWFSIVDNRLHYETTGGHDAGIHAKVEESEWQGLVTSLVDGIRAGRTVDALVDVIGRCGDLLEERGVARRADDRDELANEPRLSER